MRTAAKPAVAALLAVAAVACAPGGAVPRNVVLIVVDSLRADHLGCYGYSRDTSPNIDRWSRGAIRYARAFSQAPWTTASVASLLTSHYPQELGIRVAPTPLPAGVPTLAGALAGAGYRTIAAVGGPDAGARWGFDRDFASFDETPARSPAAAERVTAAALAAVRAADGGAPLFLFVHYTDPAMPYVRHADTAFAFPYHGPLGDEIDAADLEAVQPFNLEDRAWAIAAYDSEIAYTDRQIGALLDGLREAGALEDAVVALTGDHGEEFLEHHAYGHGSTLYEEVLHVPLLIADPREPAATRGGPVGLIDLAPTLLERAGATAPAGMRGAPLRADAPVRAVFSESARGGRRVRSVIRDGYKAIVHTDSGAVELYSIERDPHDEVDQASGEPARARELRDAVARWWRVAPPRNARAAAAGVQ